MLGNTHTNTHKKKNTSCFHKEKCNFKQKSFNKKHRANVVLMNISYKLILQVVTSLVVCFVAAIDKAKSLL